MTSPVHQPTTRKTSHFDEKLPTGSSPTKKPSTHAPLRETNGSPTRKGSKVNSSRKESTISPSRKESLRSPTRQTSLHPPRQDYPGGRKESTALQEASRRESRYRRESGMESLVGGTRRPSHWHRYGRGSHGTDPSSRWGEGGSHVTLENSYQLGPKPDKQFNALKVEPMLQAVLESMLSSETYDARQCAGLAKLVSQTLKESVKELGYPRYKYVCDVTLGQNARQGLHVASRGLWATDTDKTATARYENGSLVAVATVFAIYCE